MTEPENISQADAEYEVAIDNLLAEMKRPVSKWRMSSVRLNVCALKRVLS